MLGFSSLYAAIDLGSNSFHMLVVREVSGFLPIGQDIRARTLHNIQQRSQLDTEQAQMQHPLRAEALQQEIKWQGYVQWSLFLEEQNNPCLD
ncbi:hypothetical protein [Xenorhabdus koppenhoeferi]|uniref:Exopolyphosphatase / guanosine-5'-triphosphate,3'-diphosphate pyrophosphatase n=1 Tax=Xenorhabdus koppenhoeferi TaxID=351659 RepID=A0A1I7GMM6_9GAMM|nr:hypothetical protein [Xenorhabdus koppenhoeferi]SFU49713.1 hypothetical protein SAMN05421784_10916 [Xenorhabdus koppenhoeferi]